MKWNLWNRIVTAVALCALFLLAGSHGVSASEWDNAPESASAEFAESRSDQLSIEMRQNPILQSLILRGATRTLSGTHASE